jgi:hypothetical protein
LLLNNDRKFKRSSESDSFGGQNERDELHADLVLADVWVAESVIPFVEHGLHEPARVDVVKVLRDLNARAGELEQRSEGADARLAAAYREYAAVLLRVYEAFLAARPVRRLTGQEDRRLGQRSGMSLEAGGWPGLLAALQPCGSGLTPYRLRGQQRAA